MCYILWHNLDNLQFLRCGDGARNVADLTFSYKVHLSQI